MYKKSQLARPDLAVDVKHDGRHKLGPAPLDRESIPFLVCLPDEGMALFTYTWVNKDGEAGAAIALFGPGVGPEPIQAKLPDRPVPDDMDFSDWQIEGFSMKQDLQFNKAEIYWQSPQATIDFSFEAYHPPYSYATNAKGCPPYCANDRIEQSGIARGTITIGDRVIEFNSTGHRDHSWGTRDWKAFQNYRWFQGQVSDKVSVHFWELHALGRTELLGYVFKDGLMAEVTELQADWEGDEQFLHRRADAIITDEAGRKTTLKAEFFAHYPLIPDPAITLMEGAARIWVDGEEGAGWMEMGWQTDYLQHIIKHRHNY
jgi:hypothetical protein